MKPIIKREKGSVSVKKLGMLLGRSSRKEKTLLYISYILNVFLIATIIMVVYALRESIAGLSGTDSDQAGMMSAAMILVVVIIVVFFLWLIAMELKSLYDSRMQFNTNVRLTGFSNWKLTMLYLTELLYMQPVSVAAGIVLGELVYHLYAVRAGEILLWIQPQVLAGALALHLGMLLATVLLIGLKQGKHSAASELRGTKMHKKKKTARGDCPGGCFCRCDFSGSFQLCGISEDAGSGDRPDGMPGDEAAVLCGCHFCI